MKDPGLYTAPKDWQSLGQIRNTLSYVRSGQPVGLVDVADGSAGTMELFAVIVPIEHWRKMVEAVPADQT